MRWWGNLAMQANRAWRLGLMAGMVAGAMALGGSALAGSITIDDNTGAMDFDNTIRALYATYTAESEVYLARVDATGEAYQQYYNPIDERNLIYGPTGTTVSDADWARANLRIYDIYESLGGNAIGRRQLFQYKNNSYYVGLDGFGGQWFGSTDEAHGFLLKLLVDASVELPADVKDAVAAQESNTLDNVLDTARTTLTSNRAFLSRGRSTVATLIATYDASLGTPVVQGPPGVYVDAANVPGDGTITVVLRTTGEAKLGPGQLLLFNNGKAMSPADSFNIFVVDGPGVAEPPADEVGDTTAAATAIGTGVDVAGHLERSGDRDVFAITVAGNGTLRVTSGGGSDVVGTLFDSGGEALRNDDDGANWYNFSVAEDVTPGTYYVRVEHCCGGTGAYVINASFTP
jgi:hypothetical protein